MAKKKNGKPEKRVGASAKLPKRIAGVKVPKELREPGGRLLAAMNNPIVIDAAAAALAAAATRLAAGMSKPAKAPGGRAATGETQTDLGAVLTAVALEGVRRISEAKPPARKP
jgi:hypothetical protein